MVLQRSTSNFQLNSSRYPLLFVMAYGLIMILLGGCASENALPPTPERAGQSVYQKKAAYNRPYKIRGKIYYPMDTASGYRATGVASWYGAESGNRTAMGSRFNPNGISAAHKTLPLPCKVRVTNLRNGKTLDVLVNDRGPFKDERLIDLSRGAAMALGISGLADVQVEYLEDEADNF